MRKRRNRIRVMFFQLLVPVLMICLMLPMGCLSVTTLPGGIEPNARPLEKGAWEELKESGAESGSFTLLWFLPVTAPADFYEAVDEAVSLESGDNLVDVQWYYEHQVWILGTVDIIHVKGKVIRYKEDVLPLP